MKVIGGWKWVHKCIPPEAKREKANLVKVVKVKLYEPFDFTGWCHSPVVLITGDGHTLPDDVKRFEAMGIAHDIYCVNRSMLYFEKPIQHWAAVDADESVWFAENVNEKISGNGHRMLRHTIGKLPIGYDVFWIAENQLEGYAKHLWTGNSTMLAILSSIEMGYEKIVLAGVPLDNGPHWYEPEGTRGPEWVGRVYQQWMDLKMKEPKAECIRSMSGYSGFIFGEPTKEWFDGN